MRKQKEVQEQVLSRAGRYHVIHGERLTSRDPSPLKVKEVRVEDRRYIVCHNEDQARKDARERAAAFLDTVGLSHRLSHTPSRLSGGEQQRVAIARAFAGGPKLVFADEPTGNLDQETGRKVIDLLLGINRDQGTTLVLVTHDPALAERCSRRLQLESGRVVAQSG